MILRYEDKECALVKGIQKTIHVKCSKLIIIIVREDKKYIFIYLQGEGLV